MQTLTMYYDGKCPLCLAEVEFLQRRNVLGLLSFQDINQPTFDERWHCAGWHTCFY